MGIASVAVGFTTTAMTVGTRGMAAELSLSTVQLGWVVNSYLVAAAALVLVGGRLGDVIGRVRTYAVGLGLFAVASVVGIAAGGFWVLIAARVGQGVGAALILPTSIEVIAEYSRRGHEGSGFRWRGLVYAASFALGPLVGGILTDWFSWRWIFVLDVVIVSVAATVALPLLRSPGRGRRLPTHDVLGAALAAAVVAGVVVLAERSATWRLQSANTAACVAAVVVLGALLVRHERRTDEPLLHPFVLHDRRVLGANVASIGAALGMLSLLYFFNLFAQSAATFDHGAVSVLAALGPFIGAMASCAVVAHRIGDRLGVAAPVGVGLGLMVVGFAILATTSDLTTRTQLLTPLAIAGVGAGIANASLTGLAVLHLPAGRINEAAGWNALARFLGSAMALAVGTATFLSTAARRMPRVPGPGDGDPFHLALAELDRDLSAPLLAAANSATADRFARSMLVTAVTLAVVAVVSMWLLSSDRRPLAGPVDAASGGSAPDGPVGPP